MIRIMMSKKKKPKTGCVSGKGQHKIQLNPPASSPQAPENHPPPPMQTVGSPMMSCRAIMPSQTPNQPSSPMPANHPPHSPVMNYRVQRSLSMSFRGAVSSQPPSYASVASVAMTGSVVNMTAKETSMHDQRRINFRISFHIRVIHLGRLFLYTCCSVAQSLATPFGLPSFLLELRRDQNSGYCHSLALKGRLVNVLHLILV